MNLLALCTGNSACSAGETCPMWPGTPLRAAGLRALPVDPMGRPAVQSAIDRMGTKP